MARAVNALALISMALLLCVPVGAQAEPAGQDPPSRGGVAKPLLQADRDYYSTNVAPAVDRDAEDLRAGSPNARVRTKQAETEHTKAKHATGFPPAAKQLARREALATTKNISPRDTARKSGQANVQRARLLTLLVEFNPNANDDFSGWERPNPDDPAECITEPANTLLNGPRHNQIPNPATIGRGTDNNTFWVPDFNQSLYQQLIYSSNGVRQKVRRDLNGGVDIQGLTVKNYYLEVSKGRYAIEGDASPWLTLPHSEAWYSADSCEAGEASDVGHPDNELGTGQMAIDAVRALAEAQPSFPWANYDVEDQGDRDGDGNLFEPDGALDHVIVLHAGKDQAAGGGAEGTYAEWSSSQVVAATTGGFTVPEADGLRVFNYTTQPENAGIGVIAHEYGHDLGLPDLYDSISGTDTDVGWWDLMSTGSHSGQLFQVLPTHMGAWSKYVLGWIEPEVLSYGSRRAELTLGQGSRPPKGTESAVKINLPAKRVQVGQPHSGDWAWWSSNDQSYADVRLTRTIDVPEGSDVRFWSWDDYTIEELWDYGFIEVSTDGGANWTQLEVRDEAGTLVSTDEDPNGNLASLFGGAENGLTGTSNGYRHDWVNLTPYAGSTVQLRLRYLTDPAFEERGWFADDFSVTANGATVWSDDVEGGASGWTADNRSLTNTTGNGWRRTSGTEDYEQYYLAEWRNFDGYDNGLKTPYATNWLVNTDEGEEWNVTRTPYNAPGLLIWHRDQSNSMNDLANNLFDPPSVGSKGTVLLVDAHYDPARLRGAAAAANPSLTDNLAARQQANDVAFGPVGRYPFRYCVPDNAPTADEYDVVCNRFGTRNPVTKFTDAKTWYPGFEYRPDLDAEEPLFFRDLDASTVVPSKGNEIYSTRIVDRNGRLLPDLFGTPLPGGHVLGTGDPREGRPAVDGGDPGTTADLSLGVSIEVQRPSRNNKQVHVVVRPGHRRAAATVSGVGQR